MRVLALGILAALLSAFALAPREPKDAADAPGADVVALAGGASRPPPPVPEPAWLAAAPAARRPLASIAAADSTAAARAALPDPDRANGGETLFDGPGLALPPWQPDVEPPALPPSGAVPAGVPSSVEGRGATAAFDVSVLLEIAPDDLGASPPRGESGADRRLERLLRAIRNALIDADRVGLADALGHDGPRLAVAPLDAASEQVVVAALDARARLGGDAVPLVVAVYEDGDAVAHALGVARPAAALRVEVPAGAGAPRLPPPVAVLDVDAPFDHRVRAFAGATVGYLADYDLEISMGISDVVPILGALDLGVVACAGLETAAGGDVAVELDVAWTSRRDPFAPFTTSLFNSPRPEHVVSIDIPKAAARRFQGSVPVEAGRRWLLGMGDGAVALVTVGAAVAGPPSTPVWFRTPGGIAVYPTGIPSFADANDVETLDVTLTPPPSRGRSLSTRLYSHAGPETTTLEGPDLSRKDLCEGLGGRVSAGDDDAGALSGGVRLTVSRLEDTGGPRAFDVVLEVGSIDRDATREVAALGWDGERLVPETLRMPTARRTRVPVRFLVGHGASTTRRVRVVPPGGGPAEAWDLTISRT